MKKLLLCIALAGLIVAPNVFADPITGTLGAWQEWDSAALNVNNNGAPYWDNISDDLGGPANIGNYMAKSGAFVAGNGPGTDLYRFWGQAYNKGADTGGAADPSFFLTNTGTPLTATYKHDQAGNAAFNEFGWTDFSTLYPIFTGQQAVGTTFTFTPSASYAYYFIGVNGLTFFTNGDGDQHFAFFEETGNTYWIGMEDTRFLNDAGAPLSDRDYNDMIVRVAPSAIPEPATMLLLGSGLIGLAGYARRRFKK